jgi:hypothetical protein
MTFSCDYNLTFTSSARSQKAQGIGLHDFCTQCRTNNLPRMYLIQFLNVENNVIYVVSAISIMLHLLEFGVWTLIFIMK